ncbi:enoyl-CoA hydratase/isomerase family protein [Pigmentiphaga aceris]|uniref:3-hydroxyisobutyryl-CoA hydrolase n=1 Tax=Pigmentiphaga aceris TaxID=1940612 RepID=A0A5C0AVX9_9BURK|nr:enoyl-CoA hydratase/isomerase family protein [Pigmentiphaga aceris]QEI05876.1 enoyl-CoA hydratase/isomerase family protein [Pigmentiphaga aceris]
MSQVVLFEELATRHGKRIGVATLNAEKTLNSLSLDMAKLLDERLGAWAKDPEIALVVLQGAGEKAFCAGGDLQLLYRAILEQRAKGGEAAREPRGNAFAEEFFELEYRLDYELHTYPKPYLCWGHGIVMGGGMGLMAGASHRVVTEVSRLAMPEVTIGLFPDVGASWLLNRTPGKSGLFLGLTGAQLKAADAVFVGFADHVVAQADKQKVYAALQDLDWTGEREHDDKLLTDVLRANAHEPLPAGPLRENFDLINDLCGRGSLPEIVDAILGLQTEDPWLQRAQQTLAAGAPGSARIAYDLLRRARLLSLADVFRLEHGVALQCAARGDFGEGIRALIVDKDRQPKWTHASVHEATRAWADEVIFESPWTADTHPLAALGR